MSAQSPQEIRDGLIKSRVIDHYNESLEYFPEGHIVLCALQGSQNYNLDTTASDVDTKLIVTPTFKEIALAKKPVSTTHIRANEEHIDFKDVRLYAETFYKQNLNFLEILFTKFYIMNPLYAKEWNRLIEARESIARMNPYRAVKSMKGIAMEKYYAMEHLYPSKVEIIKEFGYDPKQLHHLVRVDDYLTRYIAGESYEKCLHPEREMHNYLMSIKCGEYLLDDARDIAFKTFDHVTTIADKFCNETSEEEQPWCRELIEDVTYNIMKIAVTRELT